jgi:hypothetical protein
MPAAPQLDGRPEVIVDVDVRDGLFSILLRNIGTRPALAVKTTFDKPFTGLDGRKAITTMRVFKGVAFMAPGKVFEQFVDPLPAYAARKEPLLIKATVAYRDRAGHAYEEAMTHDLRLYLELGQARVVYQ